MLLRLLVVFNEPLDMGDAVTPVKALDEVGDTEALSGPVADEAVAAALPDEGNVLEVPSLNTVFDALNKLPRSGRGGFVVAAAAEVNVGP